MQSQPRRRGGALCTLGLAIGCAALAFILFRFVDGGADSASDERRPIAYDPSGRALVEVNVPARRPNLVVILIDTLRGDALGAPTDSTRPVRMPKLAALAARSVDAQRAIAPCSWTLPSLTSFLTGLLPQDHGLDRSDSGRRLAESIATYPEILQTSYGYETAAFTGAPWYGQSGVFQQGFTQHEGGFGLQGTAPTLTRWNKQRDASKPFFLLLHTFEVHDPYGRRNHPWPHDDKPADSAVPHEIAYDPDDPWSLTRAYLLDRTVRKSLVAEHGYDIIRGIQRCMNTHCAEAPRPEIVKELQDAYWAGALWVDGLVEQTVNHLRTLGLLEDTLLVVTSDHGEAFCEGGMLGHGRRLDAALLEVPLVLHGPAPFDQPRRIEQPVALIDTFATFFHWAGFAAPEGTVGRSFLPAVRGAPFERGPIFAHVRANPAVLGEEVDLVRMAAHVGRWKYVLTWNETHEFAQESVFDTAADPLEETDLAKAGGIPAALWAQPVFRAAAKRVRSDVCPDGDSAGQAAASGVPAPCGGR